MRILFVHEVNYETKPVFEMHEFPELLVQAGHAVGFVHFPEGKGSKGSRKTVRRVISGRVIRDTKLELFTPAHISGGLFGRVMQAMTFFFSLRKIFEAFRPDVVVSYSVPTSGWQTIALAKRRRVPTVFRAIDHPQHIRNTRFRPLILVAERFVYRNASWVSVNNSALAHHCESLGAKREKISLDLPPLDIEKFGFPNPLQCNAQRLNIPAGSRTILFLGTFFHFAGVDDLIRSFASQRRDNEYLVLIGDGPSKSDCEQIAADLGVAHRVIFTGLIDFEMLPALLAQADIGVNAMTPNDATHNALPNKVLQYLASGLHVVSTKLHGLESTFPDSHFITYVQHGGDTFFEIRRLVDSSSLPTRDEVRSWLSDFFPHGYSASNLLKICSRVVALEEFKK